jgi:hypothetical protein
MIKKRKIFLSKECIELIEVLIERLGGPKVLAKELSVTPQLVYAWRVGRSIPAVGPIVEIIRLSNGAILLEDFLPPIHLGIKPGEKLVDFIKRDIIAQKAESLKLSVDYYYTHFVPRVIKVILQKDDLTPQDLSYLYHFFGGIERLYWHTLYRYLERNKKAWKAEKEKKEKQVKNI